MLTEREKLIVRWLRYRAEQMYAEMRAKSDWTPEWVSAREQGETFEQAADELERGDHLAWQPEPTYTVEEMLERSKLR